MISATLGAAWAATGAGRAASAPAVTAAAALRRVVNLLIMSSSAVTADRLVSCSSNSLRKPDGHPASGTDRRRQRRVAERARGARFARSVAMLEFVGAEFGDIRGKLGIVVAELVQLLAVVAVDLGLDGVGAGKR